MSNVDDNTAWDRYEVAANDRVARTVEAIWNAIAMSGLHSTFGDLGKIFGTEIKPAMVGRQIR
jgi:hypothetical protein